MTREHLTMMNELHRRYTKERHPAVPNHALPHKAYSDKTANGLTRVIIDYLKFTGCHAERVANMGRVITKYGRTLYIPGTGRNGTADIHAVIDGRFTAIEVKIGRDVQSVAQVRYAADVIRSGGRYMIVKSFEDFINQIQS